MSKDSPTPLTPHRDSRRIAIGEPDSGRLRSWRSAWRFTRLFAGLVVDRHRGRLTAREAGIRVRELVEGLGGIWIKAGQIASLRFDRLPWDFCVELMKVQDHSLGFPPEISRRTIEEELGRPIDAIFSEFRDDPIAAASIGQVHAGRLRKNGRRVAIKVRRPDVAKTFEPDLSLLRLVLGSTDRIRALQHLKMGEAMWEIEELAAEELDYRREADSLVRMRKLLKPHGIVVPRVYRRLSTDKLLVMDFIDGVRVSELLAAKREDPERVGRWLQENEIDLRRVGRRLYQSFLRQRLEGRLFHGDLHGGNIFLLRNSGVALIDFGSVGAEAPEDQMKIRRYLDAIRRRRYKTAVERFLMIFEPLPPCDLNELRRELYRVYRRWMADSDVEELPFDIRSGLYLYEALSKLIAGHKIPSNWSWLRGARAEYTLYACLKHLYPDINLEDETKHWFRAVRRRAMRQALEPESLGRWTTEAVVSLSEIPGQLDNIEEDLGERMERYVLRFQSTTSKVAQAFVGLIGAGLLVLGAGTLYLVAAAIHQHVLGLTGSPSWILRSVAFLPALSPGEWTVALVVLLGIVRFIVRARRVLEGADDSRPQPARS